MRANTASDIFSAKKQRDIAALSSLDTSTMEPEGSAFIFSTISSLVITTDFSEDCGLIDAAAFCDGSGTETEAKGEGMDGRDERAGEFTAASRCGADGTASLTVHETVKTIMNNIIIKKLLIFIFLLPRKNLVSLYMICIVTPSGNKDYLSVFSIMNSHIGSFDFRVAVIMAFTGDTALNCLVRTPVVAGKAGFAPVEPYRLFVVQLDIAHRANLRADSAAGAFFICMVAFIRKIHEFIQTQIFGAIAKLQEFFPERFQNQTAHGQHADLERYIGIENAFLLGFNIRYYGCGPFFECCIHGIFFFPWLQKSVLRHMHGKPCKALTALILYDLF
jgi:hypothetical protein